jgi:hypothetical protein
MKTGISCHQPIKQQFVNMLRLAVGSDPWIEVSRTALNQKHYGARISRPRPAANNCQERREHKQQKLVAPGLDSQTWEATDLRPFRGENVGNH